MPCDKIEIPINKQRTAVHRLHFCWWYGFDCNCNEDWNYWRRESKTATRHSMLKKNTLEITGEGLKPSKCYWYLLDFQWKKGEWSYETTANTECNIVGDKRTWHTIPRLPVEETKKIMGVCQDLTWDNIKQIDAITEKQETVTNNLRASNMVRKMCGKDSSVFYGHQLDLDYHHMQSQ